MRGVNDSDDTETGWGPVTERRSLGPSIILTQPLGWKSSLPVDTHEARSAQRELADVRAALRDATAARDRAEKEARERREEAAAAAAEAGASSRRAETREDTVRALRRRCEDQERELGALRKYVRAQREDVEAAARAILGIERARAGLK